MFDILTRELGARFGTGEKSELLLRTVLAYMTNKETGGLIGFLDQFKKAGLGPLVQSWLGNTATPSPLNNSMVENVLGGSGGLLDLLSRRVDVPRDNLAGAVAYLLPGLVAKLTPGGSIRDRLPADVTELLGDAQSLLTMPVEAAASAGAGMGKWLPVIIGGVLVAAGLAYCTQNPTPADPASNAPPPVVSAPAAVDDASAPAGVASQASAPAAVASAAESTASEPALTASAIQVELKAAPENASVMAGEAHGIPLLQVFFDSGVSVVPSEFAEKAQALVAYVGANPSVTVAVSGFNDASGDPAVNAQLSKERAEAVRNALLAQGVDQSRVVLEKPIDPTEGHQAAARRVNVVIRH